MTANDEFWMHRALELAERGRGYVEPNPLVGAVVVRNGHVVGVCSVRDTDDIMLITTGGMVNRTSARSASSAATRKACAS